MNNNSHLWQGRGMVIKLNEPLFPPVLNVPDMQLSGPRNIELTDANPGSRGWYPTLHCWDESEGLFPSAHFWDGDHWLPETNAQVQHWPIVFQSEQAAKLYAKQRDPES